MSVYLINEGLLFGTEGAVITKEDLSPSETEKMYKVTYKAIDDWNYIHYGLRIHNVDKAKFINFCLKKGGITGAKYEYLG
jgi:hypothetical protein